MVRRGRWLGGWAALAAALAAAGCRPAGPPRPEGGWRYAASADAQGRELSVDAWFSKGSPAELSVASGAEPYVRDVEVEEGGGWRKVAARGTSWFVPACRQRGCRVRYRYRLAEAGMALADAGKVAIYGGAVISSPSAWLLRPLLSGASGPVTIEVSTPPDLTFVSGLWGQGPRGPFNADFEDLRQAPYAGLGKLALREVRVAGATLDVAFAPSSRSLSDDALAAWIERTARSLATIYGSFPLPRALLLVVPVPGGGVTNGVTLGNGGGAIVLSVGEQATQAELDSDWVLTHELLHFAFPSVLLPHHWIEEGLPTYYEPLARVRSGLLDEKKLWVQLFYKLDDGQPGPGDPGLDGATDNDRVYWGGALFCAVADLRIRKATGNKRSLDDALKGVIAQGGTVAQRWDLARALRVGDEAVGVSVLAPLYEELGRKPGRVDVPAYFAELGVKVTGEEVSFDDRAPQAAIRKSLTERR